MTRVPGSDTGLTGGHRGGGESDSLQGCVCVCVCVCTCWLGLACWYSKGAHEGFFPRKLFVTTAFQIIYHSRSLVSKFKKRNRAADFHFKLRRCLVVDASLHAEECEVTPGWLFPPPPLRAPSEACCASWGSGKKWRGRDGRAPSASESEDSESKYFKKGSLKASHSETPFSRLHTHDVVSRPRSKRSSPRSIYSYFAYFSRQIWKSRVVWDQKNYSRDFLFLFCHFVPWSLKPVVWKLRGFRYWVTPYVLIFHHS